MRQEISFSEVLPGESFISIKTKRAFGGVKIVATEVAQVRDEKLKAFAANAAIVCDHVGERAPDAGVLIACGPEELVVVDRDKNPGPHALMKEELKRFMRESD